MPRISKINHVFTMCQDEDGTVSTVLRGLPGNTAPPHPNTPSQCVTVRWGTEITFEQKTIQTGRTDGLIRPPRLFLGPSMPLMQQEMQTTRRLLDIQVNEIKWNTGLPAIAQYTALMFLCTSSAIALGSRYLPQFNSIVGEKAYICAAIMSVVYGTATGAEKGMAAYNESCKPFQEALQIDDVLLKIMSIKSDFNEQLDAIIRRPEPSEGASTANMVFEALVKAGDARTSLIFRIRQQPRVRENICVQLALEELADVLSTEFAEFFPQSAGGWLNHPYSPVVAAGD